MLATDWSRVQGVPADLVRAAYAISGVFDVVPLVSTSLNDALKLDAAKAREASPICGRRRPRHVHSLRPSAAMNRRSSSARALDIAATWSRAGVKAECVIVPSTNHFSVVEELARADSAMVARIAGLARAEA